MALSSFPSLRSRTFTLAAACVAMLMVGLGQPELIGLGRAALSAAQSGRATASPGDGRPLRLLFLGHEQRNHNSHVMFPLLAAPLARHGIQMTHVNTPAEALVAEKLAYYDGLVIYGNHRTITPEQEKALMDFVEGGKAVVAIHSASFMFTQSEKFIPMIGGQFLRHGTGDFSAEIVQPNHPAMAGLTPFTTWDETYVHTRHNPVDRTVLMERVDAEGREPYTWVRTQGKGRVFYTAFGHDERTWSNPGFQKLVENGILWAVPDAARQAYQRLTMPQVAYAEGFNIPNYENRNPIPQYQLPFTAADAEKFIQVPAEFELKLFASEPDIVKPIAFNFDERGRMWIIEAVDYPNVMLSGARGNDRIKILEDTNGDGRADKFTVFADGLNLPTSLVFANGGVIVSSAPNFLFLKDTNGDDRADVRTVLSTGWGVNDSHAFASNLTYGPDNYIWGAVGYSGFNGTMNGKDLQFGQGVYRFKPDGSDFDYIAGSTNNTWGLGFSETFDVFGSTANNDPSFYVAIPNRYFEGIDVLTGTANGRGVGPGYQSAAAFYPVHPITPYIRQVDVQGGFTAAAGHRLYTARSFPKEYWNRTAFITEPTAHLIAQGQMEKDGAGFSTHDRWNLIASSEEWFAPVQAQVGPDGAVWLSDWYNFIIQHNPTPAGYSRGLGNAYDSALRDHQRGRIYRVAYRGAAPVKPRSLSVNNVAGLLEALASDNMLWRLHAQRLLVERNNKDVVPRLIALARNQTMDEIGLNGGALHALWTLHGLGELSTTTTEAYRAAVADLKHPSAGVRKAAAMVLPHTPDAAQAILDAALLNDPDLHTRLAVVLALADMPVSQAVGQALFKASQVTENYGDKWLSRAIFAAAAHQSEGFLAAYKADPAAVPFSALPVPIRLGALKPDWRAPSAADLAAEWKEMAVPGNWETRGLPDFDGVVWFTRTFESPSAAADAVLSLGVIRNSGEIWLNGISVTPPAGRGGGGGGRGAAPAPLALPAGALKAGQNVITVRIQNTRNEGGFLSTADLVFLQSGATKTSLAGPWKYRVERQTNAGAMYVKPGELAAHVAFVKSGGLAGAAGTSLPPVAPAAPDIVLQVSVIPGQMKFSTSELTVQPGQVVELVFVNGDEMEHNFVLGASGSLEQIGNAADQMSTTPAGLAQQYVPDIGQVLAATPLIKPGESFRLQFTAPTVVGQYPYLCTFPAHWRLMNGVLNVVMPAGRGRGAGAAPAPAPAAGAGGRIGG